MKEGTSESSILARLKKNIWFVVLSGSAVALLVASFIVPPTGVIDPSVLKAVGEIFAFAALWVLLVAVEKRVAASITHKDTTISVNPNDNNE